MRGPGLVRVDTGTSDWRWIISRSPRLDKAICGRRLIGRHRITLREDCLRAGLYVTDQGLVRPDGRVEDEEEEVDEDAGDGDVEPDGERPASDGFVAAEAGAESEIQSDEHERNDYSGENCVADEKREVRGADWALAGETDDSGVGVEIQIANEEAGGAADGGQHADFVLKDFAAANESVSGEEEQAACAVKEGVQARKRAKRNQNEALLSSRRCFAAFVGEIKNLEREYAADHQANE